MAAWKRKGGVDKYRVKLVGGLLAHGYTLDFAEALFRQIEGFGEYGFPESHAASFALLAYASSWLKRHEPEAFLAALLNSPAHGLYAPAQLVQDARRHGVRVLPPDVMHSGWDSALETPPPEALATPRRAHPHAPPAGEPRPAVRLGLSLVQGLREEAARRIEAARAQAPYTDTGDLARRAALTRHELNALAAGDALRTLAGHRRQASWEAAASASSRDLLRHAAIHDVQAPALSAPDEGQSVAADYRSVGLTLRSHPVALLRPQLAARNFQPAAVLNTYPHRRVARLRHRHRAATAADRQGRDLRDAGGRDRPGKRGGAHRADRAPAPRAARLQPAGRLWRLAERGRRAPPDRATAGGYVRAAGRTEHAEPELPLRRSVSVWSIMFSCSERTCVPVRAAYSRSSCSSKEPSMIRKLIPVLLAATLSACANTGAPRSSSPSSDTSSSAPAASSGTSSGSSYSPMASGPSGKTCDASALQSEIGKKATPPCWKTCARAAAARPPACCGPASWSRWNTTTPG